MQWRVQTLLCVSVAFRRLYQALLLDECCCRFASQLSLVDDEADNIYGCLSLNLSLPLFRV